MEKITGEYQDINSEQVQTDNAVSIAAANKKSALVVVIDQGKLVDKDTSLLKKQYRPPCT
ncbi:MAG: hypothetical protein LBB56_01495 [Chitinispirillales bacterium]|jgi:hypothetical protein|nr:hypothetical protein [Chitinispirillales bacterium]